MTDLTIQEFCYMHCACSDRRDWALANCRDVRHAWDTLPPDDLIWAATRPGVLDDRVLRLFACWCVRQVWRLIDDPRSRGAVDVAERFAVGEASSEELDAALDAAQDAAVGTARIAAWGAAWNAAVGAAWNAAWDAELDAARNAAVGAARIAARDAARNAAWGAQAEWLRQNAVPCFELAAESAED